MPVGQGLKSQPESNPVQLNKQLEEPVNILVFEGKRSFLFVE